MSKVAGAIAGLIRDGYSPSVQAVGPSSVYKAVMATAFARDFLIRDGLSLVSEIQYETRAQKKGPVLTIIRIDLTIHNRRT